MDDLVQAFNQMTSDVSNSLAAVRADMRQRFEEIDAHMRDGRNALAEMRLNLSRLQQSLGRLDGAT